MPRRGLPDFLSMRHDEHYVEALAASAGAPIGRTHPHRPDRSEPQPAPAGDGRPVGTDCVDHREGHSRAPARTAQRGERFQIVAGERRYQAAVQVGLRELPVVIRDVDDTEVIELALIENLQRKDLTPFEEAEALHGLADRCGYTHEDLARRVGKSRTLHYRVAGADGNAGCGPQPVSAGRHFL